MSKNKNLMKFLNFTKNPSALTQAAMPFIPFMLLWSKNYSHFWRDCIFRQIIYYSQINIDYFSYNKYKIGLENLDLKYKITPLGLLEKWESYLDNTGGTWNTAEYPLKNNNIYSLNKYIIDGTIENASIYKMCYITRGSDKRRNIINEYLLIDELKKRGVYILNTSNLCLKKQMQIFNNCELLIALHGACMSNILFMKSNTKVIEIFPPNYYKYTFKHLSQMCNLNYIGIDLDNSTSTKSEKYINYPRDCSITLSDIDIKKILLSF